MMRIRFKKICWITLFCFVSAMGYAEEQEAEVLETVTVTAQKREENVQEVPISMSVFDGMDIEDKMVETLDDIAKYTPGLTIINYGAAVKYAPSIRGLYSDYSAISSVAGLFIDGVPVTNGSGFDETLLDIERIEVLKGPQGTLYGKNTEIGAVNVITKKPSNETRARITGELGEDNKRSLSATASGALIKDKLYLGVYGKHYEKDGFVENTRTGEPVDDREHNYGKIYLRMTPTDNLEASLISSCIKYDNGGNSSGSIQGKDRAVSNDLDTFNKSSVWSSSLNISYTLNENLAFTAITAYRNFNEYLANDFDYTSGPTQFHVFADSTYETLSQELRANYEVERFNLVSGIFLESNDTKVDKTSSKASGDTEMLEDIDADTIGIFSHLTYKITDRLSALAGLRYDKVELEYQDASQNIDGSESELSPKVGLTYDLLENVMTYVTVSKGFRCGGFNAGVPEGYPKTYDPETLYAYEVGAKGILANGKLSWDVGLYYMDITDMHVSVTDIIDDAEDVGYMTNAAEATSMGVEASLTYQITRGLNLFAGFSYNKTEFDEYNDGFTDYSGNKTTFSPKYNYTLGMTYRAEQGYYASADLSGYGDMYLDLDNEYKRPAYELVNAKIGYETEKYDIYLYAKNLFDRNYDTEGHYGAYTYYSQPREIGVSMTYRL
ncbi:TonB-dependent receptor [uncultured Desulfobacter sp.]|uniref:TonB-dependent receptor n=1 Tax=uncultured Desulfobacter sp. TaxID=240139 RepID=UPI002AA8560E|nr:TonB-dependent receptor [uncultured Desulfobacter sp.]